MDLVEISLQTTLGFDVKFDIEAIEHYNGVHTASDYPTAAYDYSGGNSDAALVDVRWCH